MHQNVSLFAKREMKNPANEKLEKCGTFCKPNFFKVESFDPISERPAERPGRSLAGNLPLQHQREPIGKKERNSLDVFYVEILNNPQ